MPRKGIVHLADSPLVPVVTLAEAKLFLKVDFEEDDDLIEDLVETATTDCEDYCNAAFVPRTVVVTQAGFIPYCPGPRYPGQINLPIYPVIDVVSVAYRDEDGETQPVDTADVVVVTSQRQPFLVARTGFSWPSVEPHPEGVTITLRAGFETIPKAIKTAILFRLSQLYRLRDETDLDLPASTVSLLRNFRLWPLS